MKTYQANMLNVLTLIAMSLWAYFAYEPTPDKMSPSVTTFIPLVFGVILLLCHNGIKKENKIIAHVAVLVTLLSVIGLTKPFMSALDEERFMSVFRVGAMILTGVLAMTIFIQSFIRNRRKNKM
ncbi:MAG: hypothetical protein ABR79_04450 [Cryomorphaceae bacterium BACL11 MAG-121001-bin54]|jgi:hypothetical protein|nr:MAG: hypothetical protein ABR79_04450 [Cryomorphaceae bacterium BACL11 MAG-121001-bin54]KRO65637.1 MAG: hypothetical protein ABR80_00555 [Cryomorphaceae bacterium BACL11 MAG-121015-bin20]MBC8474796.1 hypothetical protein [Cryomorphaceae bacterium]